MQSFWSRRAAPEFSLASFLTGSALALALALAGVTTRGDVVAAPASGEPIIDRGGHAGHRRKRSTRPGREMASTR